MSIGKRTLRSVQAAMLVLFLGLGSAHARDASQLVAGYAPLRPVVKPAGMNISPQAPSGHIVVKFRRGAQVDSRGTHLAGTGTDVVRRIFEFHGLALPVRMVSGDVDQIRARRMAAEDRLRVNLPDMSLYFRLPIDDPAQAVQVIAELNAREEVEVAYFEPRPEVARYPGDASASVPHSPYALAATTPSFVSSQDYIEIAPGGVDARGAWTLPGGDGTGTRVIDIEYGWQLTHEDLSKGATAIVIGVNPPDDNDHGTAVLGEMAADRNTFGTTGIAYNADIGISSVATMSFADAVDQAAAASDPGDCVLIELHSPGPRFDFEGRDDQRGYVPMEYFQANFDALLNAWAQGAIVCEAAGNGEEDLDDPIYESLFDTTLRNSHAIMCGAGNPPDAVAADRSKLGFSNWGERVNLQGYGTLVYTLGYGDLYDGGSKDSWYTELFGGTSSASPIVTGAVLCLSGVYQQMLGTVVDADSIRNLLVATGSPQQQPLVIYHIGPRPDLGTALDLLFDPTDTVWYGNIELAPGTRGAIPVTLSNSNPVAEMYLPFDLSGDVALKIDSLTRGPRTLNFEKLQIVFDNRFFGQAGYLLRADNGGGTPYLQGGSGVIAYLWVTAPGTALPGQAVVVDSTWLGTSTYLRLVSYFDSGYPDDFASGMVTITGVPCDCPWQGDLNADGLINVIDVVLVVDVVFRGGDPAPTDPSCPHATRADYNCDHVVDVLDAVRAVGVAFRDGPPPCDPCEE